MLDAIGGGGWGPIVTSTLLGQGAKPRYAIGTVNLAEFFVTVVISTTFFVTVGLSPVAHHRRSHHRRSHCGAVRSVRDQTHPG